MTSARNLASDDGVVLGFGVAGSGVFLDGEWYFSRLSEVLGRCGCGVRGFGVLGGGGGVGIVVEGREVKVVSFPGGRGGVSM